MSDDLGERTEDATPKRRREARLHDVVAGNVDAAHSDDGARRATTDDFV